MANSASFSNAANAGVVSQQASGISANGGTLNNARSISGTTGVSIANTAETITNSSTILGTSGEGIVANGKINVSITNTGTIVGVAGVAVRTDTGSDTFNMNGGTVTGQIRQGDGFDAFTMTAGQIDSLDQGDGTDMFNMSGGRIVGVFIKATLNQPLYSSIQAQTAADSS